MFRKSTILKVGNYNKSLREAEDFSLIEKMIKKKLSIIISPFHCIDIIFMVIIFQLKVIEKNI